MKVKIELEIDLGDSFIDEKCQQERQWLFEAILVDGNLYVGDKEIGDILGETTKVISVEEIVGKKPLTIGEIKEKGYITIYSLAITNQSSQGNLANKKVPLSNGRLNGSFEWDDTPEGYEFWELVNNEKFEEALKLIK